MSEPEDKDLPLLANVTEILVNHYSLNLACNFEKKSFYCSATIFLTPVQSENEKMCLCSEGLLSNEIECPTIRSSAGTNQIVSDTQEGTGFEQYKKFNSNLEYNNCCLCIEDLSPEEQQNFKDNDSYSNTQTNNLLCSEEKANIGQTKNNPEINVDQETNEHEHNTKEKIIPKSEFNASDQATISNLQYSTNEKPVNSIEDTGFVLLLDCHQIIVKEVLNVATLEKLSFSVSQWALKVWKGPGTCRFCFPRVIKVIYETVPACPSLLWVKDQMGK